MAFNFLNSNESKTEVMVLGPTGGPDFSLLDLGPLQQYVKPVVTTFGVKTDSDFKMDQQKNCVIKSSFYHLRLFFKIISVLSFKDFERVIHSFITTRLDLCNVLYAGISQASLAHCCATPSVSILLPSWHPSIGSWSILEFI